MKTFLFFPGAVLFLLFIISNVHSQTFPVDKGSINFGGDIRISSSGGELYESDGERLITSEIKPYFGYFLIKQMSLGSRILMQHSSQKNTSQTAWGIGPVVRYYSGDIKPKRITQGTVYFFFDCGFFYKQYISEGEAESMIYSGIMVSTGLGMCYMLSNSVGFVMGPSLEMERMYSHSRGDTLYGNNLDFSCGFTSFLYNQY